MRIHTRARVTRVKLQAAPGSQECEEPTEQNVLTPPSLATSAYRPPQHIHAAHPHTHNMHTLVEIALDLGRRQVARFPVGDTFVSEEVVTAGGIECSQVAPSLSPSPLVPLSPPSLSAPSPPGRLESSGAHLRCARPTACARPRGTPSGSASAGR
ncbi:unnamed protein product [Closterium sp. Naga37s-1]|nr:unnamed protein product [Closterium sp. Naga37s-1]